MLGNHPFAWFITFAFFYEVFKEHPHHQLVAKTNS
jgi:hypothetical protein